MDSFKSLPYVGCSLCHQITPYDPATRYRTVLNNKKKNENKGYDSNYHVDIRSGSRFFALACLTRDRNNNPDLAV